MAVKYSNNATTTLPGAITDSATSITVTDGSTFPAISSPDYAYLTLASATATEVVKCTNRAGNVLTVLRAQEGTTASAFTTDDRVELRLTSAMLTDVLAETVANATTSATNAAASATSAAASYDAFDDRWLGTKSSNPTLDNDGNALQDGAAYFNTTNNVLMVYDLGGTTWNRTTPTATDQAHVNTVSGIAANVTTVAGVSANVTTVAGIAANVTSVAGIAANVTAVAGDAADIGAVAGKATEIGLLGTADAVADMAILGTAAVVADLAILGTADVVTDMNVLATADVVTDLNTLGTADVVTDMNVLGTAANVTAMGLLGNATTVANMGLLGTADAVADMNTLATTDIVADLNQLATSDFVTDLNVLATADVVADMNTLGTAGNVTNMNTVAGSIADVNRYAEEYTIAASAPGSPSEGDLWYDSSNNVLKVHNGTSFVAVTSATAGITDVVDDTTPQLGGNLDMNGNNVGGVTPTEMGYVSGVTSALQTQLNAKQATITGSATTIDTESLTASRAVISNGSQKIAVSAVTDTELGYVSGVTSAIQTQLNAKQATITGSATTIDTEDLTASRAVISNGSQKIAVSAVTDTELGYLSGVTSAVQTQLGTKQTALASVDMNGTELILDEDADTSIHASSDDTIDIKIANADDFQFTANTFTVLSGSTLAIASGATIANSGTATGFTAASIADADNNTKIQVEESSNENKIRFDTNGTERMVISENGQVSVGTTSTDALVHLNNAGAQTAVLVEHSNASEVTMILKGGGNGDVNTLDLKNSSNVLKTMVKNNGMLYMFENVQDGECKMVFNSKITMADDATMAITGGTNTGSLYSITAYKDTGGVVYSAGLFHATYQSATITELSDPGSEYATTDSDGFVCIYKSNASGTTTVKNRTGQSNDICVHHIAFTGN